MNSKILIVLGIFFLPQSDACKHVGNKTTFYDMRCSQYGDTSGCGAGGQSKNCRFCGFENFPDCPTPPPLISLNETLQGQKQSSIAFTTASPFVQRSPLYGVNYSPFRNSSLCSSISESMIDSDLERLASIADVIRLYSMECDFATRVVQKSRERGVRVILGVRLTSDESHYRSDRKSLDRLLLDRADLNHVIAVSVGQDSMARHHVSETMLVEKIRDIRSLLHSYGYNQIPITTSDVFEKYNSFRVVEAVDVLLPNLKVFSSEVSAELSPRLVFDMMKRLRSWSAAASKEFFVGETGWPSGGDLAASPQSSWSYLKRFRCQAIGSGVKYFYFEAFDAAWKQLGANSVDSHFGLGTFDRRWKPGMFEALRC